MANRKRKVGSPSPANLTPRFVIEDGESIEVAAAKAVHYQTQAKRALRKAPPIPKPVTVTLQMRHSINGRFYGPGTVTLSEGKARTLLNTEHEAIDKESSLYQQRAFIIGFRNGVPVRREVPAQQFDTLLMREELPLTNMGGM